MIKRLYAPVFIFLFFFLISLFAVPAHSLPPYDEKERLYQENISILEQFTCLSKELVKTHSNLGYLYAKRKEWDKAIAEYLEVLEYNPKDKNAHFNLGYLYTQQKDYQKAIKEYEEVLAIDPKDKEADKNLAYIQEELIPELKGMPFRSKSKQEQAAKGPVNRFIDKVSQIDSQLREGLW